MNNESNDLFKTQQCSDLKCIFYNVYIQFLPIVGDIQNKSRTFFNTIIGAI